ncbi:MAG: flagellin lysine-N-methylase [Clostridia bacterium]|nr:flagellin lysine-N-methylase [Clostridia bacterium]
MKQYVLSYYPEFKCIADKCKHTCCAGWEMLIDKDSLNNYLNDHSPFSQTLKRGVNFKKSKFKTDKLKRCAFLNQNGLCDIITNFGEESLCQVCRDHPRFRSFFSHQTETGLGFSCEQATKIILSYQNKMELLPIDDDGGNEKPTFLEQCLLEFRTSALKIVQDRNLSIDDRIKSLLSLCNANICEKDFSKILKCFFNLERLDKGWTIRLKALKKSDFTLKNPTILSLYFEQFFVNSIYRHLPDADDVMSARERTIAIICTWLIIKSIFENEYTNKDEFILICDIVRAYSAEVEYSQKNLNKLFRFASALNN